VRSLFKQTYYCVQAVKNRPDSSGWKIALAMPLLLSVEVKGIFEIPSITVQT